MFFAKDRQYRNATKGPAGADRSRRRIKKKGTWMIALDVVRLGRIGVFAASALAAATTASAQTPIKFSLDFKFEGPAAPFVVAIDKGYFKAEGLDVTIDTAGGSLEPMNRVASGT